MCAKQYENLIMLSKVTAKNVGDVFFETHCSIVSSLVSLLKSDNKPISSSPTSTALSAGYSGIIF